MSPSNTFPNAAGIPNSHPEKLLLTPLEASASLSISPRKLWELTNCGTIKAVRIGRSVRYSDQSLRQFIDQQSQA